MATAIINTAMVTWARERLGYSLPEFAAKCATSEDRMAQWESGERPVTFKKAMMLAEKAHIPFGYLFLTSPPVEQLPIPDLRTLDSKPAQNVSAELLDLTKLMLQRQEWYREFQQLQLADQNTYVGRFSVHDSANDIVTDIRKALRVEDHPKRGTSDDYYRDLVSRIESIGILVMRQANMGHFTRPLLVEEFRGFAITDNYAPLIFINHSDSPGARLFTLIHELCHIWIGKSGLSDGDARASRSEEVLCNAVAAEFLVPATEFIKHWNLDVDTWHENLAPMEAHFRVSRWVLARRALTLGYIQYEDYHRYIEQLRSDWVKRDKSGSGPTYYRTKKAQISLPFSRAVVGQALSGQLLLREASALLDGIKPAKIPIFAKEITP